MSEFAIGFLVFLTWLIGYLMGHFCKCRWNKKLEGQDD